MDSVPPATTMDALPVMIVWAPRMMAFRPDAQTLLTVVQTVVSDRPARTAHWRAGAWPRLTGGQRRGCGQRPGEGKGGALGREDIAKEDLLDLLGVDAGPFHRSCEAL